MTPLDLLGALRRSALLVVAITLVGIALGAAAVAMTAPLYTSSTLLFVSVRSAATTTAGELVQGNAAAQQKVQSYVGVATSPRVLQPVVDDLDDETTLSSLAPQVSAETPVGTVNIRITVVDADPSRAARLAGAIAESFRTVVVDELETPAPGGTSLVGVETLAPPVVATTPSSPDLVVDLLLGGLVGLCAGVAAAALRARLDTRIRNRADIEAVTGGPVLGALAFDRDAGQRPLVVAVDPRSPFAESFRALRTSVQFIGLDRTARCLVVTSALPAEGKTTTVANLAVALSETGSRVIVVDTDLRLPRLAELLGLEGAVGVSDVLLGRADLADAVQPWGRGGLAVLPAGTLPPNPSELLGSNRMADLLGELARHYDHVLLDAPPLLPVTDAAVLSRLADGAIVVAAAGRATRGQLATALETLSSLGATSFGVVATMLRPTGPQSYGYGYGYTAPRTAPEADPATA
ncbi:polysaccharide biosynthesis tyrosine autokinase [Frigoribacterium sp. Leaf172]|uniref:polysaccharide biosynthesis tyrosine autokinase n=1 Tax=Frigoribacterium sp. Leaf172 TaxID=1736285 RepID=UPI0006FC8316|nr:polysaccharide biosynthesis tyrosine autokinase [Frigoribacterium sp. Leaf172]KQR62873.1 hypothetical protein ASF89_13135 [Frigoribacterium sp. Leaf172]